LFYSWPLGLIVLTAAACPSRDATPSKETPTKESSDAKKPGNDVPLTDKDATKKEEKKATKEQRTCRSSKHPAIPARLISTKPPSSK